MKLWSAAMVMGFFGAVAGGALAQAPNTPSGGALRDIERSLPTRQITSPDGVKIEVPEAPALSSVSDNTRITVREYRITGNTVFEEDTLLEVIEDRTGTLSIMELRDVTSAVASYYRDRGYLLATSYLPEQEITDGVITIAVLEGRYDELAVDGNTRLSDKRVQRTLTNAICDTDECGGSLISSKSLERGLLLLNDTPGAQAAARLSPGGYTGSSQLDTMVAADQLVSGYLQMDNLGSYYTGVARATATMWVNSPLGIGDQITVQAVGAGHHGNLYYGTLGYGLPLGYSGARLALRGSHLKYELGDVYRDLEAHGTVKSGDVALLYPFVRSLDKNLHGSITYGERRFNDQADAVGTDVSRRITERGEVGLNGDFVDELFGVGALNTVSLLYTRGELELEDPLSALLDVLTAESTGEYDKWALSLSRLQPLFGRSSLYLRASAQATSDNLDSYEKFALGGPNSVRAYPMSDTLVDEAVLYSAEWRQRFGAGWARSLEWVLFYDRAHGNVNAAPWSPGDNHVTLDGAGTGFNYVPNGSMSLRAFVAFRGDRPMTAAPDNSYHYNLTWTLSF